MTTEPRRSLTFDRHTPKFPPGITPELFAAMFDRVNREHWTRSHDLPDHRGKSVVIYGGGKVIISAGLNSVGSTAV